VLATVGPAGAVAGGSDVNVRGALGGAGEVAAGGALAAGGFESGVGSVATMAPGKPCSSGGVPGCCRRRPPSARLRRGPRAPAPADALRLWAWLSRDGLGSRGRPGWRWWG
jgi:hypothetical protein